MPTIPTLKESQRISQGGVSGFQDTSIARSNGENISLLGRTIASAANSLRTVRKEDKFSRSQWVARAQAEADREKNRFLSVRRDGAKEDDGSTLEEDYDKQSSDRKAAFIMTVPEDFRSEADMAFDTAKLRGTADVLKESEIRRKNNQLYGYQTTTNELINSVTVEPDKAGEYLQKGLDSIQVATNTGILSPEKLNDNIRGLNKKVVEAQVNGYLKMPQNSMDIKYFDNAKESLEKGKDLFSPEEYAKMVSGIEASKYTGIERIIKRETDAADKRKEANKNRQETEIAGAYQQIIENRNDPEKVAALKTNLIDRYKAGKFEYAAPSFFKAFKQGEDSQDAAMSYEIAKDLGSKPTNKMINDMRDRIKYSVANDRIGVEKGEYWLKRLDTFNEANKKDPNHAVKVKSIYTYIKAVHNVSDIENMTDISGEKQRSVLFSMYQAETMLGKGMNPEYVLAALKSRFTETKQVLDVPKNFPFSEQSGQPLDNPEAFTQEEGRVEDLRTRGIINSSQYRDRMRNIFRMRQQFEGKKTLKEKGLDKFINELNTAPVPSQLPIPLRR